MVRSLLRLALCLALAVLFTGCTMFISRIHVQRAESEPAFTHAEREKAKVIALEIGYRRTVEFTRSFKELFRLSPLEFRRIWSRRECAA